jgi:predicted RNA binding protein YcfA (HicA-like mRNA interferase family)
MPSFSYIDVTKRIKRLGFVFLRQAKGSHEFWRNAETGQIILIAKHNKDFATGTMKKIVKELGFRNLKDFENFRT